jgi:hydrogenase/urease accessory protein HupE
MPQTGKTLCAIILALLAGTSTRAHEIGTTRVSVVFKQGRAYEAEIVTDAATLAEKLGASGSPDGLQARLNGASEQFLRRVAMAFDNAEVRPAVSCSVAPGTEGGLAVATVRLTGAIPPSARQFTWKYGWTFTSYALTVRSEASGAPATQWLEGGRASQPFQLTGPEPPVTRLAIAWRYLTLGFTHIVPHGLDHMLFVLGIYLLSGRARSVLLQVSAFTVAHSITLGLSIYGVIAVSSKIVEPAIAISIAYVAIENLFYSELKCWRVVLVFVFGLLHGMGFAGALTDLGLPRSEFVTALFTFNAGVEAGQLAVIGAAFLLVGWPCANRAWYRNRIVVPASILIACTAVYWTIERLAS